MTTTTIDTDQLRRIGRTYDLARDRAAMAREELRTALLAALAGGMSESEAARVTGLSRMTVRAWQGK